MIGRWGWLSPSRIWTIRRRQCDEGPAAPLSGDVPEPSVQSPGDARESSGEQVSAESLSDPLGFEASEAAASSWCRIQGSERMTVPFTDPPWFQLQHGKVRGQRQKNTSEHVQEAAPRFRFGHSCLGFTCIMPGSCCFQPSNSCLWYGPSMRQACVEASQESTRLLHRLGIARSLTESS